MNTNGLAGLIIPGGKFEDDSYASLKLRLDCYDDYILARKFDDGAGGALYALDPLDVAGALAGMSIGTPLLPKGVLFWQRGAPERLAIYIEPQVWTVHVSTAKRERLAVPLPGLVWLGQGVEYRLYAVKNGWPDAGTELFNPPCPNVSSGVCRGNVEFPQAAAGTIWQAWAAFIESDFNNHLSGNKSLRFKQSVLAMWRELAGATEYPLDDLVSAGKTLGKLMKETGND